MEEAAENSEHLKVQVAWAEHWALPLLSCVSLGKLLYFSVPQFLHL